MKSTPESDYARFAGKSEEARGADIDRVGTQATVLNFFSEPLLNTAKEHNLLPVETLVNFGSGPGGELPVLKDFANNIICVDIRPYQEIAQVTQKLDITDRVSFYQYQRSLAEIPPNILQDVSAVKTRFTLVHIPIKTLTPLLSQIADLLPSGGLLIAEEPSDSSPQAWKVEPELEAFTALHQAFLTSFDQRGANASLGQELPDLLAQAGLKTIINNEYQIVCDGDEWSEFRDSMARIFQQTLMGMQDAGAPSEIIETLQQHLKAYQAFLKDLNNTAAAPIMAQIVAVKS